MAVQYQLDGNFIHFRISGVASGWLGFGISSDGSMDSDGSGSDIVVGYSSNSISQVNNFTTRNSQPQLDETQNIYNTLGTSHFSASFSLPFTLPLPSILSSFTFPLPFLFHEIR